STLLPHVDIEGEAEPTTQEPAAVPQHQGATAGGAPPDGEGHADGRLPDQTVPTTHAWPEPSTPVHEPTTPADPPPRPRPRRLTGRPGGATAAAPEGRIESAFNVPDKRSLVAYDPEIR